MSTLICFGFGYCAEHFLEAYGQKFGRIIGTVRGPERAAILNAYHRGRVQAVVFDGAQASAELTDAIASGVAYPRFLNLSECALAVNTLSQIVARIIEVGVVGEIGKAALDIQPEPLREPEILSEPQGEVNCAGANHRPYAGVAKAANDAAVGQA